MRPSARAALGPAAVLAAAFLVAGLALAVVAARSPSQPRTLQERTRAVASSLRCPVCQDLSVADSPSGLARQMRAQIARELQAGESPDRVRAGFVRAYGDWILLSPPRRGLGLVVWMAPILLLLAGLVAVGFAVRRWTRRAWEAGGDGMPTPPGDGTLSAPDRRLLERAMAAAEDEPE